MPSVLIIGKGSREYAIKDKLVKHNVFMVDNREELNYILNNNNIDLVIVGSEKYLVEGIVDELEIPTFGPTENAARVEGSKIFAKNLMSMNNIPTAEFKVFYNNNDLFNFFKENDCRNYVIKEDGLAAGKGVYLPENIEEIKKIKRAVVVEERLFGQEVSVMAFCNGHELELMPQIKDYKRIEDGNKGLNTGGMGAIGPVSILNPDEMMQLKDYMLTVVKALSFKGVLYAGVMKTDKGLYILEFNCRFGDPETQVILNLLESDLYDILNASIKGEDMIVKWSKNYCANVVLSHIDYPLSKLATATQIKVDKLDQDIKIYWANPVLYNQDIYTYGGRVASVVNISNSIANCLDNIYNNIYKINYEGRYYRKDIGLDYLLKGNQERELKIGIISSSRGSSIVKLLEEKNIKVEIIISNRLTSILEKAKDKNLPFLYLPLQKDRKKYYNKLANILESFDLDIIFAVGYMDIFPPAFCDNFAGKLFNIHPSLLPQYKGMYGNRIHQEVLAKKETISGCTLHHVTSLVDDGKIVMQKQYRLTGSENVEILKNKIQKLEAHTIIDFVRLKQNSVITYKDAGVNIEKGDDFVAKIKDENIGSFCGIYELGNNFFGASTDGVGTKLELANQYDRLENIGFDLVAMCVNDLIVRGIKPKIFLDYIAMNKLNNNKLLTIIASIKEACREAGCILMGGETAEMPGVYKYQSLDLAGFSVGLLEKELYPQIDKIEKGCKIYGLKSNGIHSNGYSMVRNLLKYHDYDIDILLQPTKIYMECFDIMDKYQNDLAAMAHITGGGLTDNIKRVLPVGITAKFEINITNEFAWIMDKSGMNYEQMLNTFNCGYGIALIFRKDFVPADMEVIGYLQ